MFWWLKAELDERVVVAISCGKKEKTRRRQSEEVVGTPPLVRGWVSGDDGGQAGGESGGGRRPR
jgi:hypothetical protein